MSKQNLANICFDCKNAVPDKEGPGCEWSRKFEPVPGWTATPKRLNPGRHGTITETYEITACPMYDTDGETETERTPNRKIKVRCIETGVVFDSITSAANALGRRNDTIAEALRKGTGYAYGFHWEKVET